MTVIKLTIPKNIDELVKQWMLDYIKQADKMVIFQSEKDRLMTMYSKYLDTTPSESERFEDIKFLDYLNK